MQQTISTADLPRRTGVVLEGGGFRGLYTAGVLDVWMEHGVTADGTVGVSAGAAFGYNFKSRQVGRVLRYNTAYRCRSALCELAQLVTHRRPVQSRFCLWRSTARARPGGYRDVSLLAHAFYGGSDRHQHGRGGLSRPRTRRCERHRVDSRIGIDSRAVASRDNSNGRALLDGGAADSIPVAWMREQGYQKIAVVLTQPRGYRKKPNRMMPILRLWLHRYPHLVELLAHRHEQYNACLEMIERLEREGTLFVIRPSRDVSVPAICKDPQKLEEIYEVGRADALDRLDELQAFFA